MISKKYLNIKVNLSFIIVLTLIFTGSCSNIEHDKISGSFGKPLLSVASGFLEVDFSEPAINDEYYPNNKKILINFDMPIDASTVIDTDTIVFQTLKADGEVKLTCTGDIQIIGESITYLPTGPIGSSCEDVSDRLARLTLRAGGIGSTVDGTTYFLQNDYTLTHEVTRRGDQDIEPPIIQNITPENNAVHVSSATNILVVFSEAIDPASINDINFSVLDAGEAVAGSFLIEGANVTFTPNVPLTNFTTYTVSINNISDLASNIILPFTSTFTTAGCGDGILQTYLGEECDDGNLLSTDVCSSECQIQYTTVSDSTNNLIWKKCSQGQNQYDCSGTATMYKYCSEANNDCNSGTNDGKLGLFLSNGSSTIYDTCESLNAIQFEGYETWRVPTSSELSSFYSDFYDSTTFPNTVLSNSYWSSSPNINNETEAFHIPMINGLLYLFTKDSNAYVRCVADQPVCGDGILQPELDEECDTGGLQTANCEIDCKIPVCGDGTLNSTAGEQCDDGSTLDKDGCSSICQTEVAILFDSSANLTWLKCSQGNNPYDCSQVNEFSYCNAEDNDCNGGINGGNLGEIINDGESTLYNTCENLNTLQFSRHTNWRVPTSAELIAAAAAIAAATPTNPDPFDGYPFLSADYWSSTSSPDWQNTALVYDFYWNITDWRYKSNTYFARCISSGSVCGDGIINFNDGEQCDDGNVADNDGCSSICGIESGIITDGVHVWMKCSQGQNPYDCSGDAGTFQYCNENDNDCNNGMYGGTFGNFINNGYSSVYDTCESLNAIQFEGYTTWRLPNKAELNFLYNSSVVLTNTTSWYWSSDAYNDSDSMVVSFDYGFEGHLGKMNGTHVRCIVD